MNRSTLFNGAPSDTLGPSTAGQFQVRNSDHGNVLHESTDRTLENQRFPKH